MPKISPNREDSPLIEREGLPGAHSPVQEQQIDFLLEEEFLCDIAFLSFFIAAAIKNCATGEAINRIPLSDPSIACHAIRSVTTSAGESDVLVIYRSSQGRHERTAILIENKIGARFQPDQADRYRKRGAEGLGKDWDSFWTCLVSPRRYGAGGLGFDSRVPIEEIHRYFAERDDVRSRFRASILRSALDSFSRTGLQIEDLAMTEFRRFYSSQAELYFSRFGGDIQWPQPRPAWHDDTWFNFRSRRLPKGSGIIHKCRPGLVHMYFENTSVNTLRKAVAYCAHPDKIRVIQTGKSASIELIVPPIKSFALNPDQERSLATAFLAVEELVNFFRANEAVLRTQVFDKAEITEYTP